FSSRRRHTRFSRDWSSDVCSSDLKPRWPHARRVSWPRAAATNTTATSHGIAWLSTANAAHATPAKAELATAGYRLPRSSISSRRSEERRVGKEERRWGTQIHEEER